MCASAGDDVSLAIGMFGQVIGLNLEHRHREASVLASEQFRLLEESPDALRAVGVIHGAVLAKLLAGEAVEAYRLAQWSIDLVGGDPVKGRTPIFGIGSPLAVALLYRGLAGCSLGRHDWRNDMRSAIAMQRSVDAHGVALPMLEPRCRICRNDQARTKVNDMLAAGASYAMVLRALAADNAELDKCDRVTIDSVRNHCGRHFPVQNVAKATYREILERRAKANGVDFVEGVATAITPIAFFETVMVKSYETLVDSDTRVDVNTGIVAAGRLQSLIDSGDYSRDMLVMKVQLGQICDAVKSTVPQEMWGTIVEKLEELEQHQEALDVGTDSFDDADDEPYDPTESSTRTTTSFDVRIAQRHRGLSCASV